MGWMHHHLPGVRHRRPDLRPARGRSESPESRLVDALRSISRQPFLASPPYLGPQDPDVARPPNRGRKPPARTPGHQQREAHGSGRLVPMVPNKRGLRTHHRHALLGLFRSRRSHKMHYLGIGSNHRMEAKATGTQAHVRFLAIHEVFGSKAAKLVPERPRNQEETSHHDVNATNAVAPPSAYGLGIEQRASRKYCAEPERRTYQTPKGHSIPA